MVAGGRRECNGWMDGCRKPGGFDDAAATAGWAAGWAQELGKAESENQNTTDGRGSQMSEGMRLAMLSGTVANGSSMQQMQEEMERVEK